jgi:DNA-binding IclR family transcriptional regulator
VSIRLFRKIERYLFIDQLLPAMPPDDDLGTVQSARTLFDIVECVEGRDGTTVTEVSEELGYAKSTVHRHLTTLKEMGYVIEESDGFHVGLRFLDVGHSARVRQQGYDMAKEKVEEIATETSERAQFLVEEHGEAVYIHRAFGERAVRTDPGIGSRIPLYATAAGKAILANLNGKRRTEIVESIDFEPITAATITETEA